jgi:hypothetical protein
MTSYIVSILTATVAMINNLIAKLTVVNVEFEAIDVELETVTLTVFSFATLDAAIAARQAQWTIDTSVEVVETEVAPVEFDFSSIIAALGLATEAPVAAPVAPVAEEVVETVTVNNVVYTIHHKVGVDVRFSGRVHAAFTDVEGYLFEGTDGTSDFLLRVQAPLSMSNAKAWMSLNNETRAFDTKVVVTPTYKRI